MLKQVRGALKGIGAWFIIILLILAFALWGVPEMRTFGQRTPLKAGDVSFSRDAILNEFNRQVMARREATGRTMTRSEALAAGLPDQVVSGLALRSIVEQEAQAMGLAMPRSLVRDFLHTDERFFNPATGRFDEFALQNILSSAGYSVRQFEAILREDLLRGQLIETAAAGGPAPGAYVDALLLRQIERRRVGYLTITDDMAGAPAEPTPDDLRRYYNDHPTEFTAPEYRTFSAIILREEDFAAGLEPPEEQLRAAYENARERLYEFPERRTLYQVTYESESQAQAAVAALEQGRPFEGVAADRGLSLDSATFADVERSDLLDPNVAAAAFAADLAEGDVVGPIQGLFGWTVLQIADITPPETRSFEDVRDEIARQFTEQDTRRQLFEAIETIEEARDAGATLAAAAEAAGLEADRFGPVDAQSFAPGGTAIVDGIPGEVLAEAFRLEEGEESLPGDLAESGYFFVQVEEISPAALRPYEDVDADVQRRWRAQERRDRIAAAVRQVTDAVSAGESFEDAAAPFNRAILETVLARGQTTDAFSETLAESVFAAAPSALVSGPAGLGSAQTIVEVREIGYARNEAGPGQRAAFRQYFGFQLNQELLDAYLTALQADYGVRVDQNTLDSIFSDAP